MSSPACRWPGRLSPKRPVTGPLTGVLMAPEPQPPAVETGRVVATGAGAETGRGVAAGTGAWTVRGVRAGAETFSGVAGGAETLRGVAAGVIALVWRGAESVRGV